MWFDFQMSVFAIFFLWKIQFFECKKNYFALPFQLFWICWTRKRSKRVASFKARLKQSIFFNSLCCLTSSLRLPGRGLKVLKKLVLTKDSLKSSQPDALNMCLKVKTKEGKSIWQKFVVCLFLGQRNPKSWETPGSAF